MSLSPVARQVTQSQAIPSRRMVINSASQLPNDYSTTPGGTIYSTTPGGNQNTIIKLYTLIIHQNHLFTYHFMSLC